MCKRPWVNRELLISSDAEINTFLTGCVKNEAGRDSLLDMIKVTEELKTGSSIWCFTVL